jgi:hypothetical protein
MFPFFFQEPQPQPRLDFSLAFAMATAQLRLLTARIANSAIARNFFISFLPFFLLKISDENGG